MTPTSPSQKCSVLVIEDEELMRDLVCESLDLDGHACFTAATMEEAMQTVETHRPKVVLLDLHVAHVSTEPWIERIRRSSEVVLFSASPHCKSIATRHGIDALSKPFDLDDLSAIIKRLCAVSRPAARS